MYLAFRNNYGRTVSVAVMKRDQDGCGQYGGWATKGWWVLAPGEKKSAIYTTNRYAYFYALATDGTWWGDPNGPTMYVNPYDRFESCYKIGTSTWDVVSTRRADLGTNLSSTHTVNLNP
ncbi:DUF1036 domain-containing protein [Mycolicibacterium sp. KC 300]|jgi:uncharacterized membrane protein|uniref:DUF1036 domain-containing protein n=3 Tax=Mycobacteriaceae TaxID=1762 RepID=A0A9X3BVR0_9MYCO|nr:MULTISPECIES: DUF1036 domain-containing protein [Mycolicibacterium]MCV7172083.1 DUF1036 domain-containing protein [[Mycobacterium] manitobense]MDO3637875.1 DUF1036 domain-containing protein [Mycolicibacterium arseniciresistens]